MAFTISDFQGLLRVLEQHPEWRAELRRQVLTDEILELPAIVSRLADRMDTLAERMDGLVQAQARTEGQIGALTGRVGALSGDMLELRFSRRGPAYFSRLARRLRTLEPGPLAERLDDAINDGRITRADHDSVILADLVLTGRGWENGAELYVLAELSVGIGVLDVQRALDRSRLLQKLGAPVIPVVAGEWINEEAQRFADDAGVAVFLERSRRSPTEG